MVRLNGNVARYYGGSLQLSRLPVIDISTYYYSFKLFQWCVLSTYVVGT